MAKISLNFFFCVETIFTQKLIFANEKEHIELSMQFWSIYKKSLFLLQILQ